MKKLNKNSEKAQLKDQTSSPASPKSNRIEFTQNQKETLFSEISSGASMREAADVAGVAIATVYRMMHRDQEFSDQIASARRAQQDSEIEKCVEMADLATPEDWQVVKLRIWARQWRASKLAPKKFGDRLAIAGDEGSPLKIEQSLDVSKLSDSALKEILAAKNAN
ncbi:MAG: hypothetical protein RLZZ481_2103 [Pseudomonadota bacterium]